MTATEAFEARRNGVSVALAKTHLTPAENRDLPRVHTGAERKETERGSEK